jgi:hypothetical protein
MSKVKIEKYVDAMLESSSVAAHDISGQIHVMQFCVEELENHISTDGIKYLNRLQDSLDEVTDLITFYRSYIKKSSLVQSDLDPRQLVENVIHSLQVHFWNEFKKLKFDTSSIADDLEFNVPNEELHSVIFSLMAIYLEELKKGQLTQSVIKIQLKVLDSKHCEFTLESELSVDSSIYDALDEKSSPGAKAFRKNLGHSIILDSDKYELDCSSKEEQFKISLKMKVING